MSPQRAAELAQISFTESAAAGPVTLAEGEFKIQQESIVLGYLARKYGSVPDAETGALIDSLVYESAQPVRIATGQPPRA